MRLVHLFVLYVLVFVIFLCRGLAAVCDFVIVAFPGLFY